jgi:hypothetical protein
VIKGFIPIKRSLFEHFLFKEHRVFSRFEAWLDLIQLASFTDGQTDLIGGKLIIRNRGEVIASVRWLCKRWGWSIHKVSDYVELLRSQLMVTVDKESGIQKIMLVNFEKHNSIGNTDGYTETKSGIELQQNEGTRIDTAKKDNGNSKRNAKGYSKNSTGIELHQNQGTQKGTAKGTIGEQSGNSQDTNYNKVNKDNKLKKEGDPGAGAPPQPLEGKLLEKQNAMVERQKEFYNTLIPFVSQYSKKMIRAFFDYWREPNKSKTKMKYELEDTWDVAMRLAKWEDNDRKWNKKDTGVGEHKRGNQEPQSFKEEIKYLISRNKEQALDERLIKAEHYDKLQSLGYIPVGTLDRQPGATIEEKKKAGVLEFIKTNSHAQMV